MIASTICVVGVYCYATMVTVGMQPLWNRTSVFSMSIYCWIAFPVSVPPALEKGPKHTQLWQLNAVALAGKEKNLEKEHQPLP